MNVKNGKADLIQDPHYRYRDHCSGMSQWGERLGSTPNTAWARRNL